MFRKSNQDETSAGKGAGEPAIESPQNRQDSGRADSHTRSVSYIGPSLEFVGDVFVSEALIIEGHVKGSVTCRERRLSIGRQGHVEGELHAEEVAVRGRVDGDIYGYDRVRLHNTAVVAGTLHCKRIIIDDGASLNGGVDMNVDRKDLAKRAVKPIAERKARQNDTAVSTGS